MLFSDVREGQEVGEGARDRSNLWGAQGAQATGELVERLIVSRPSGFGQTSDLLDQLKELGSLLAGD